MASKAATAFFPALENTVKTRVVVKKFNTVLCSA